MAWSAIAEFPESLILLDASNKITFINSIAREKFNIPAADENSVDLQRLFAKPGEAERLLTKLNDNGTSSTDECTFVTGHGTELRSSCKASTLRDENGVKVGVLLLFGLTSNGRLKDYASRLESKIKELDQFAYIVSHDLKAPLRAIGNLTSWIREDLEGSLTGDSKQNMDLLVGRVTRMEALINGVLEYSRIGRIQVKPELVDLHVLLNELIELLAPPPHVKVVVDPNMPSFVTRQILLSQVFSNLISNAIKHNDKKEPVINVGFNANQAGFEFFVEDNGPGIAKEHHEKIFVIFQTLQSRDKFESTGVGLTIVKRIVEEQGGIIRVESTEGKGSKFIFTWPELGESEHNVQ
jgi:light-regulated signal transduction histidine kinase (bacteriophytochrome)